MQLMSINIKHKYKTGILKCWIVVNMHCQVRGSPHISWNSKICDVPGKRKEAQTFLDLSADVLERTQMDWVFAAKASGDWDLISLKSAPKKRRSDAGAGRKLS